MQLKTFRGNSMASALCAVKKELGKDAVIVHTRTFKVGGVMGVGGKEVVEVIAAVENAPGVQAARPRPATAAAGPRVEPIRARTEPQMAPRSPAARAGLVGVTPMPVSDGATRLPVSGTSRRDGTARPPTPGGRGLDDEAPPQFMRVRKRLRADASPGPETQAAALGHHAPDVSHLVDLPLAAEMPRTPCEAEASAMRDAARYVIDGKAGPTQAHSNEALTCELGVIKAMLGELMQGRAIETQITARVAPAEAIDERAGVMGSRGEPETEDPLSKHYQELLSHHVSREIVDRVLGLVRDDLSPQELRDTGSVRSAVLRRLAELVPTSDTSLAPARQAGPGGRPFTMALVGPTGVGKTTTIAKLAAAYKLRQGRRVGLITADTYRVGAVEQLSAYAGMIGVPLKVAATESEMRAACDELGDMDIVLIDTAGRSPHDGSRLGELGVLLEAAAPDETHLVLSMTASEPSMLEAARRFGVVGTSRVIFTKLDEAVTFGVIFNVAQQLGSHLSFVTTGQEVPDQIESTKPERLARLMLGPSRSPLCRGF